MNLPFESCTHRQHKVKESAGGVDKSLHADGGFVGKEQLQGPSVSAHLADNVVLIRRELVEDLTAKMRMHNQ